MNYILQEYRPFDIKNFSHRKAGKGYFILNNKQPLNVAYYMYHNWCIYRMVPHNNKKLNRAALKRITKEIKINYRFVGFSFLK
jgi:hypothetical protein